MARVVLRGRAQDMETLSSVLAAAAGSRQAAIVVVDGPPGIGKSALLASLVAVAEGLGFRVGSSKTDEIDKIALGAPLLVALRSGRRPLVDAEAFNSLAPLYDKYVWLIERVALLLNGLADDGPVMIAIDDVQWADPLTRFALRVLPSRLAELPIVWLLTSRLSPHHVADEVVASVEEPTVVVQLTLEPLPGSAIDQLARDRLGTTPVARVREALRGAGGNPYWAVQVLDGFSRLDAGGFSAEGLELDLGRAPRHRLESLSPEARDLVELASVWGRMLPLADAADLLGPRDVSALRVAEDAEDSGLILVEDGAVRLPHDLLREAIYREIPSDRRVSWHRRIGQFLASRPGSALMAATHYRQTAAPGDLEAARVLLLAARDSINGVPEQAAELAMEALGLVPEADPAWQQLARDVLDLLVLAQLPHDAVIVADRLIAVSPDAQSTAWLEVQASRALWEQGSCQEMVRRCDAALALPAVTATTRTQLRAVRALAKTRLPERAVSAGGGAAGSGRGAAARRRCGGTACAARAVGVCAQQRPAPADL